MTSPGIGAPGHLKMVCPYSSRIISCRQMGLHWLTIGSSKFSFQNYKHH